MAPHIERRPGPAGAGLRIVGKGVLVQAIAVWRTALKMTPQEIADGHGLSLAEVHAALAYYYEHKSEIDAAIREEDAQVAQIKSQSPSLLQQKIRERFGA